MERGSIAAADESRMYEVDELALTDEVRRKFMPLSVDEDTHQFLSNCFEQSEWLVTQVWHSIAKAFLGLFMTQTSINGLLNRGRMFVWSEAQARLLLGAPPRRFSTDAEDNTDAKDKGEERHEGHLSRQDDVEVAEGGAERELWVGDKLLDLGAGDGYVTQVLEPGVRQVYATETSSVMRKRLRERGYRVLDAWEWAQESGEIEYDVVTCLNLLDRCDTPRSLLREIHAKLTPSGTLVVALVLPFNPYVETGTADNLPSEELGIAGSTLEEQVNCLATHVFPSLGYTLTRWSRLPYLCEGDLDQAFYWLSDVVLVFRKTGLYDETDEEEEFSDALENIKVEL
ncbi:protein-L-histidine N-pros-methyltransferase-like isoform X2 [Portunus trituberculatus]|uniref:protein-L-histidine N-pros-methyltransferase-like isoform X2 n=1 Tax=Portunus trituberculatus TaxID=210409 RepID=UPI001E1CD101|nr:protein-L-histidine N-pros-methyltransferase-like isoform X2 [Portunus trituberculatus]